MAKAEEDITWLAIADILGNVPDAERAAAWKAVLAEVSNGRRHIRYCEVVDEAWGSAKGREHIDDMPEDFIRHGRWDLLWGTVTFGGVTLARVAVSPLLPVVTSLERKAAGAEGARGTKKGRRGRWHAFIDRWVKKLHGNRDAVPENWSQVINEINERSGPERKRLKLGGLSWHTFARYMDPERYS